uniref:Uncharacterized protein n=1 Tax=Erpetoichthys calabaricus TaxID=27687 RepID=A0A8C4XH33_ERPCA
QKSNVRRRHQQCAATMAHALQSQQFARQRKHLPRISLIKNESRRFEEDHIPS